MYLFRAKEFSLTENEFHFIRNNTIVEKSEYKDINRLDLCTGAITKRPTLVVFFGLLFIVTSLYFVIDRIGFDFSIHLDEVRTCTFFLVAHGSFLIFRTWVVKQGLTRKPILNIYTRNGRHKKVLISDVLKSNRINELVEVLIEKLNSEKLQIEESILENHI